ncbi:hypothetical protein FACS189431_0750 [Alphaproteobacteria bacterium]|nr:hypothetical protein FACS189431_0750 [Alphaproteobacteria bacterium]
MDEKITQPDTLTEANYDANPNQDSGMAERLRGQQGLGQLQWEQRRQSSHYSATHKAFGDGDGRLAVKHWSEFPDGNPLKRPFEIFDSSTSVNEKFLAYVTLIPDEMKTEATNKGLDGFSVDLFCRNETGTHVSMADDEDIKAEIAAVDKQLGGLGEIIDRQEANRLVHISPTDDLDVKLCHRIRLLLMNPDRNYYVYKRSVFTVATEILRQAKITTTFSEKGALTGDEIARLEAVLDQEANETDELVAPIGLTYFVTGEPYNSVRPIEKGEIVRRSKRPKANQPTGELYIR